MGIFNLSEAKKKYIYYINILNKQLYSHSSTKRVGRSQPKYIPDTRNLLSQHSMENLNFYN